MTHTCTAGTRDGQPNPVLTQDHVSRHDAADRRAHRAGQRWAATASARRSRCTSPAATRPRSRRASARGQRRQPLHRDARGEDRLRDGDRRRRQRGDQRSSRSGSCRPSSRPATRPTELARCWTPRPRSSRRIGPGWPGSESAVRTQLHRVRNPAAEAGGAAEQRPGRGHDDRTRPPRARSSAARRGATGMTGDQFHRYAAEIALYVYAVSPH